MTGRIRYAARVGISALSLKCLQMSRCFDVLNIQTVLEMLAYDWGPGVLESLEESKQCSRREEPTSKVDDLDILVHESVVSNKKITSFSRC